MNKDKIAADTDSIKKKKKTAALIKFTVLLFIVIGIPIILYINCRDTLLNSEWLSNLPELLKQYRGMAALILIGIQILQVIICILPGQPIQFAASYLFGILIGYLISVTGAVIGAGIAFGLAKVLGQDALELIFGREKVTDYQCKLNSGKGLTAVLLIYLIPGIPKDLTSYVAGISGMKLRSFLLLSTIGRSPAMIGSLLFGFFLSKGNYPAVAILCAVVGLICLLCFIKRKAIMEMMDRLGN